MAQVVELEPDTDVGPSGAPPIVDQVVVPGLSAFVEQPSGSFALGGVAPDVRGEDLDDLIGQVDGALRLELGRPDHHGDPRDGLDEGFPLGDVSGFRPLDLAGDPERTSEEVYVSDLHPECFTAPQTGEGTQGDERGESPVSDDVGDDWRAFITQRRDAELDELIEAEALKGEEARVFVAEAFRDGSVPTTGTAITRILPPASRFSKGNDHGAKKQRVLGRLIDFFERYTGLV